MQRGVAPGVKLESDCGIDRSVLTVGMKVNAEINLSTRLEDDAGTRLELMTVVADAITWKVGLGAIGIDGGRAGVMKRFMAFDRLHLDGFYITLLSQTEIDDDILPIIGRLRRHQLVFRPLHHQIGRTDAPLFIVQEFTWRRHVSGIPLRRAAG